MTIDSRCERTNNNISISTSRIKCQVKDNRFPENVHLNHCIIGTVDLFTICFLKFLENGTNCHLNKISNPFKVIIDNYGIVPVILIDKLGDL